MIKATWAMLQRIYIYHYYRNTIIYVYYNHGHVIAITMLRYIEIVVRITTKNIWTMYTRRTYGRANIGLNIIAIYIIDTLDQGAQ